MTRQEKKLYKLGYSLTLRYDTGIYWGGVRFSVRFTEDGIEFISHEPNGYVRATAEEMMAFADYWDSEYGD